MLPVSGLATALSPWLSLSQGRAQTLVRRCQKEGVLSKGGPGRAGVNAAAVGIEQAITFLLAGLTGETPKRAVELAINLSNSVASAICEEWAYPDRCISGAVYVPELHGAKLNPILENIIDLLRANDLAPWAVRELSILELGTSRVVKLDLRSILPFIFGGVPVYRGLGVYFIAEGAAPLLDGRDIAASAHVSTNRSVGGDVLTEIANRLGPLPRSPGSPFAMANVAGSIDPAPPYVAPGEAPSAARWVH